MSDSDRENVKILLVDDQPARLLAYEAILDDLGLNLVMAKSGVEALEFLLKDEFAVILLDVSMPGMDGFETAAVVREHPRVAKTPIIFVTAFHLTDFDKLRGYELGAVDYVLVPVVPEILRSKVSVFVELHERRRELVALNRALAQTNAELAAANSTLQAEKSRELERLNETLRRANADLEQANRTLTTEIAERSRLGEALRDANLRKDEFLATLAHELRNPLAPILNGLNVLQAKARDDPEEAWCRDLIRQQVRHMSRLVDDLLDVARIGNGKIELKKDTTDLADVVARAVETIRPSIDAASQSLTVALPRERAPLHADPVRIAQVLSNLLDNAAKYGRPGGHVRLEAVLGRSPDGSTDEVVVRVIDDGIGIPAEILPRVFDPFVQADRSLTRAHGGLGIGLALVKRLVEMHGGAVEAHSAGPDRGSEFVVRLPLAAENPSAPDAGAPAATDGGPAESLRVLVVDDNVASAQTMSLLVRKMGHDVATAYDGLDALAAVPEFAPDVVLLDIGMPKLDGYEVARRIRATRGGDAAVLVALTGWGQAEDRRRSSASGFDHHVVKPVDGATLRRVLARRAASNPPPVVESVAADGLARTGAAPKAIRG